MEHIDGKLVRVGAPRQLSLDNLGGQWGHRTARESWHFAPTLAGFPMANLIVSGDTARCVRVAASRQLSQVYPRQTWRSMMTPHGARELAPQVCFRQTWWLVGTLHLALTLADLPSANLVVTGNTARRARLGASRQLSRVCLRQTWCIVYGLTLDRVSRSPLVFVDIRAEH